MPVPHAPHVSLAADEQHRLESIVRAHSTPQALSLRCQLILGPLAADRPSNLQWLRSSPCDRHTVAPLAQSLSSTAASGSLQDAPRPGRPRRFSPLPPSGGDVDGHS